MFPKITVSLILINFGLSKPEITNVNNEKILVKS